METGLSPIAGAFAVSGHGHGALAAFSFLLFNLLCAPCFAAIGAIRREMNSARWTWFAIGYQCLFAYAAALVFYQTGLLATGGGLTAATAASFALAALVAYGLARNNPYDRQASERKVYH